MRLLGLSQPRPCTASGLNKTMATMMNTPNSGRRSTNAPATKPTTTRGTKMGPAQYATLAERPARASRPPARQSTSERRFQASAPCMVMRMLGLSDDRTLEVANRGEHGNLKELLDVAFVLDGETEELEEEGHRRTDRDPGDRGQGPPDQQSAGKRDDGWGRLLDDAGVDDVLLVHGPGHPGLLSLLLVHEVVVAGQVEVPAQAGQIEAAVLEDFQPIVIALLLVQQALALGRERFQGHPLGQELLHDGLLDPVLRLRRRPDDILVPSRHGRLGRGDLRVLVPHEAAPRLVALEEFLALALQLDELADDARDLRVDHDPAFLGDLVGLLLHLALEHGDLARGAVDLALELLEGRLHGRQLLEIEVDLRADVDDVVLLLELLEGRPGLVELLLVELDLVGEELGGAVTAGLEGGVLLQIQRG